MSQRIQGLHALASGEVVPAKRKRGRPRKDLAQAESTPAGPAPDSSKKGKQGGGSGDEAEGMLGQVVTGVIDGAFDAGYLLNVKVGDNDTLLRGVVFLPGRFIPITEENDVAPLAKMYKRRAVPFPNIKRQSKPSGSVQPGQSDKQLDEPKDQVPNALAMYSQPSNPQSKPSSGSVQPEQSDKQPVEPKYQVPNGLAMYSQLSNPQSKPSSGSVQPEQSDKQPVEPKDQVLNALAMYSLLSNPQSGIPEAPERQSSAVMIPPADNVPKTDSGLSLSGKVVSPRMEPKVDEPSEVLQEIEASKLMKGPNEVEANEESKIDLESQPVVDTLLGAEASKLMKGPNEVGANEESKAEPESEPVANVFPGVETSTLVKGTTDVEADKETKEQPAPPPVVEISHGGAVDKEPETPGQALSSDSTNDLIHDEVKTLNLELNQAPVVSDPKFDINKSVEKQDIGEGDLQEEQPGHAVEVPKGEGKPVGDATNTAGAVSLSAVEHTQEMMSKGEAVPAESKLAYEGHVPAGPTEPEIRSPSGGIISMECDEKDAIPPPSQS